MKNAFTNAVHAIQRGFANFPSLSDNVALGSALTAVGVGSGNPVAAAVAIAVTATNLVCAYKNGL